MNQKFEDANKFKIEMTKSEDGIFYPKGIYFYLDDEVEHYISGVWLDAHVAEGVRMTISYALRDKDGNIERDENGVMYGHWRQELPPKETLIMEDEDDIELVEDDE